MRLSRTVPFSILSTFVLALSLAAPASASKAVAHGDFASVRISNFGQMDDRFYRGAQPKPEDYSALSTLGIKTVIDLRDDPTDYEKSDTESAGMHYVNIPMSDKEYPSDQSIQRFLSVINDPNCGKFYVHCAGGRHRTGLVGAIYRFNHDHWNFDQVYDEMKSYDFYTRFGHGDIKKYVEDYWQRIQAKGFPANYAELPGQSIVASK